MKTKKNKKGYKKAKFNGGVSMSLYELNQQIMSQMHPISDNRKKKIIKEINDNYNQDYYYMFLCNERHYYTVFHYNNLEENEFTTLGEAVMTLIDEMGAQILAGDNFEGRYEIWLRTKDKENHVFLLFPYGYGVVNYG